MAEKIVKGIDIVEKGALSEHIEQAKQLLVVYKQLDDEVKSTATSLAKMSKGFKATKTGDVGTAKATSDNMNKALIEQERLEQAQIRTKKALLQFQKLQQTQANKTAKAIKDEGNAYKQQSKTLTDLINRYQNLAARGRENGKVAKGLLTEINKLDAGLKKIDATVGRHQRNVGNYTSALNGLKGAASKVTNVLGQLGLAVGAGMVFQDGIKTLIAFDERLADIAKTTGLSIEGAKALSNELLKIDTRTSVDGLQQLAVAAGRLGIEGKQNIVDFVNAADKSFVALGDDLGGTADEIATSLGKISAVFGDEEEFGVGEAILKTGSALNELSANSKASAGNILDFTNRMAGVASVAGIAQTDIQALGAFFDDAGQSIEVAATTLNVLLPELAKDQERFAKVAGLTAEEFGLMLKNAPIEALKAVAVGAKSSEGGLSGLVQTLEGFGIESARGTAIVGTLASGVDELTRLQGISNVAFAEGTSLTNEFNIKNQTTGALLEKLKKEWDKQILGIGGTTAASEKFRGALTFLIKNLGTILNVVVKVGKAFLIYKSAMMAIRVATVAQVAIEKVRTNGLKSMFVQQTAVNGATEKGTGAVKLFGKTINAVPIAMLITGLTILVTELLNMESASAAAARALDEVTESTKLLNEEILSAIENTKTQYQDNITQRIETLKNAGKTEKEIQEDITSNYIVELEKRKKALEEILAPDTGVSMMTMDILAQNFQQGQQIPLDNPMGVNPNQKTKYQAVVDEARNERIAAFKKELDEINLLLQSEKAREESSKKLIDNYKEVNVIEGKINSNREKSKEELSEMAKLEKQLQAIQLERSNLIIRQKGEESDRTLELKIQERELKKQIDRYKEIIEAANKLERVAPIGAVLNTGGTMTTQEQADKMLEDAQREYEYYINQKQKTEEETIAAQIQLAQDLTDITTFLTDKRIEAIDREIEAEKRKYDESKQNIDAIIAMREMDSNSMAQSIAFEKAEQAKALAAQEKLQRKKQRLELLNTSIGLLNAQVAAGNGDPLAKTMADVTTLIGFIKSIPMFWEGTETTVGDSVGTKFSNGRDGILARVDKSEMILNKSKVDKLAAMGIHSTDDVVKRLMLGNGISNVPTSMVAMNDNSDVVNELAEHRALLKQLVNKPVTNTTLEQVGKVVKMIETVNKPHRNIVTVKQKRIS